jgi:hypothetical protein
LPHTLQLSLIAAIVLSGCHDGGEWAKKAATLVALSLERMGSAPGREGDILENEASSRNRTSLRERQTSSMFPGDALKKKK